MPTYTVVGTTHLCPVADLPAADALEAVSSAEERFVPHMSGEGRPEKNCEAIL